MKKRIIKQRTRIFIAAEGQSEQSFVTWLQQLSDTKALFLHLDCQTLDGGGYTTMLDRAVLLRNHKEKSKTKAKYSILLVDSDRAERGDDPLTLEQLKKKAYKYNFRVCAQRPNLEGLLWRMLPNNKHLPIAGADAHKKLRQAWSGYQKPADARTLATKFSLDDLLHVADKDPELKGLLSLIGLN